MQVQIITDFLRLFRHYQGKGFGFIPPGQIRTLLKGQHKFPGIFRHHLFKFPAVHILPGITENDTHIIYLDFIKLIVGNALDGILDTKTGKQQGRASPDAENHHEETLLVTENISGGYL